MLDKIAFQNSILTHVFFNTVLFRSEYSKVLYLHKDDSFNKFKDEYNISSLKINYHSF